jgi:two-component system cell cycle response regulator
VPAEEGVRLNAELMRRFKAPHRPVMVVLSGQAVGARVTVDRSLTIGRDPDADLALPDSLVSWHHARLEDRGDSWTLVDLDSTNGCMVNSAQITEAAVKPGDRIVFGDVIVSFELHDAVSVAYSEVVERLLNVDDLSGLFVRRKFDAEFGSLIDAGRAKRGSVALLVMDLDGIKKINDTHGHLFGAYVIGEAGRVIGEVVGERGIACRFGGDEYLAALPALTSDDAMQVGKEILSAIRKHHFEREGIRLRPGISIGVAAFPEDADEPVALFQRADEALYRAKQAGKGCVRR